MPCRSGALLPIHLLAGAGDLGPLLDRVGPGAPLGELPQHAALHDVGTRLETENGVRQLDRSGRGAIQHGDCHFHVTPPRPRRDWPRPPLARRKLPAIEICPASAPPWAVLS